MPYLEQRYKKRENKKKQKVSVKKSEKLSLTGYKNSAISKSVVRTLSENPQLRNRENQQATILTMNPVFETLQIPQIIEPLEDEFAQPITNALELSKSLSQEMYITDLDYTRILKMYSDSHPVDASDPRWQEVQVDYLRKSTIDSVLEDYPVISNNNNNNNDDIESNKNDNNNNNNNNNKNNNTKKLKNTKSSKNTSTNTINNNKSNNIKNKTDNTNNNNYCYKPRGQYCRELPKRSQEFKVYKEEEDKKVVFVGVPDYVRVCEKG